MIRHSCVIRLFAALRSNLLEDAAVFASVLAWYEYSPAKRHTL